MRGPRLTLLAAMVSSVALDVPVRAQPSSEAEQCADAFEGAQRAEKDGKLLAARKLASTCSRAECPSFLIEPCKTLENALLAALPTIIPGLRDRAGGVLTGARVLVDHVLVQSSLEGVPLEVDPGHHVVRYELDGRSVEVAVSVVPGDKNRPALAVLPDAEAAAIGGRPPAVPAQPGSTDTSMQNGAYASFGIGAGFLTAGIVSGAIAINRKLALDEVCAAPETCPPSARGDIDLLQATSHVSTVGLGLGVLGLGLGTLLIALAPKEASSARSPVEVAPDRLRIRF